MRNFRILALLAILSGAVGLVAADRLNVYVGTQRYLDQDRGTILHLDYQIPYDRLVFLAHKGGYFAELDISIDVTEGDSLVFSQNIRDNIGISSKEDAQSDKSYLNRVSFQLGEEAYRFRMQASDVNSGATFEQTFELGGLTAGSLMSDLELCSAVRPDSSSYLSKFRRGNILHQTKPSRIFDKGAGESFSIYFEAYTKPEQREESSLIVLTIERDSMIVSDSYLDFTPNQDTEGFTLKVPLEDLPEGKYLGSVELQVGERSETREFVFFVREPREELFQVFADPAQDYQLLRYFLGSSVTPAWDSFDEAAKRRYISQSWKNLAQSNKQQTAALLETVRERVDYANRYFGHFDPGWTTDRGRIHIRNGKPDEIEGDTTSDDTRYVRKDYEIWKYRSRVSAVYLFVDIQMSGNYKLVYADNDERESSYSDYLRYLGDDFDTSLLEN